ncbi:hypothetical protein [Streptomyces sirii]|uniref:hypothetical protein n=1 Tax=Streptomyces sirii TaxID=3127701 RepID=UPI003D365A0F
MARSELERLARIRIQITGETLERAMAVLGGEPTPPEPATEPSPAPGHDSEPEADRNRQDEPDTNSTSGVIGSDTEPDGDAAAPDSRRKPRRRNHLRGL